MMNVILRAVHGTLRHPDGSAQGAEIAIHSRTFLVGTAADCHLRCAGRSVSPHHCLICIEPDRIVVRDCQSQTGTLVNRQRIDSTACLFPGDQLQVGKLVFEVEVRPTSKPPSPSEKETVAEPPVAAAVETVDNLVADMLTAADDEERERRRLDPHARLFRASPEPTAAVEGPNEDPAEAIERRRRAAKEAARATSRTAPGRLPPPPDIKGTDTVDAASQALSQYFANVASRPSAPSRSGSTGTDEK